MIDQMIVRNTHIGRLITITISFVIAITLRTTISFVIAIATPSLVFVVCVVFGRFVVPPSLVVIVVITICYLSYWSYHPLSCLLSSYHPLVLELLLFAPPGKDTTG